LSDKQRQGRTKANDAVAIFLVQQPFVLWKRSAGLPAPSISSHRIRLVIALRLKMVNQVLGTPGVPQTFPLGVVYLASDAMTSACGSPGSGAASAAGHNRKLCRAAQATAATQTRASPRRAERHLTASRLGRWRPMLGARQPPILGRSARGGSFPVPGALGRRAVRIRLCGRRGGSGFQLLSKIQ